MKICGITCPHQGRAIAQLGAAALGFVCVRRSPRYIRPDRVREIGEVLPEGVDRVGVFANSTESEICQVADDGSLTGVQLHGDESPQFCDRLRQQLPNIKIIKAFRVKNAKTLDRVDAYTPVADMILLDAYHPQQLGGTGQTIDPTVLQSFDCSCPWLLAGGLTPNNVLEALQSVKPNGIDLSSGVEVTPGDKDLKLVEKLFHRLRERP